MIEEKKNQQLLATEELRRIKRISEERSINLLAIKRDNSEERTKIPNLKTLKKVEIIKKEGSL